MENIFTVAWYNLYTASGCSKLKKYFMQQNAFWSIAFLLLPMYIKKYRVRTYLESSSNFLSEKVYFYNDSLNNKGINQFYMLPTISQSLVLCINYYGVICKRRCNKTKPPFLGGAIKMCGRLWHNGFLFKRISRIGSKSELTSL